MRTSDRLWHEHFKIQSEVDLDFVIGQKGAGYPVGMTRDSPPEFRRRILAGSISYALRLRSIDYALKRYVASDLYESKDLLLGDAVSDYLRDSVEVLSRELSKLHTQSPTFGTFGAEITLFRLPSSLDVARMLSNRGLLLEVLPVLRLCLEMMAWSSVAFNMQDEYKVRMLKAQFCVVQLKDVYSTAGKIYGYLSKFSHWGHVIHGQFLDTSSEQVAVLSASVRYRAMSLALCLVILDVFVVVVRNLYLERSADLVGAVQGVLDQSSDRNVHRMLSSIADITELKELEEIQLFLL